MDLHIEGVTMMSANLRIAVPPSRIRDVQQLLGLEGGGFLPHGTVHYDPDLAAFVLDIDGEAVSHVLDLLSIAMDTRGAETWNERQAREMSQLRLQLAGEDVPYDGVDRRIRQDHERAA